MAHKAKQEEHSIVDFCALGWELQLGKDRSGSLSTEEIITEVMQLCFCKITQRLNRLVWKTIAAYLTSLWPKPFFW